MEISSCKTKQIFSNHARMPPVISTHFLHVNDITVYEYTHEESTSAYSVAQSGNFLWLKALENFEFVRNDSSSNNACFLRPDTQSEF